ncbi:hypothetical protein JG687_00011309 [Phytophthora cactorum]|uniref:Uncharacterized protein n=1 Tax=Phytophthora cactorum TaxID=29920 RepID=A0A8T1U9I1_9STRA|nr:hypothetical protein JG687_00011309 [Phytophthora cactorum]
MFQYATENVKKTLTHLIDCVTGKADLVRYCVDSFSNNTVNKLYGMLRCDADGAVHVKRVRVSSYAASLLQTNVDQKSLRGW